MADAAPFTTRLVALTATAFLLLAFGSWLLRRGHWPPRRGGDRYCRRCGYNLFGQAAPRCPECGSELASGHAVVIGQRQRRPAVTCTGIGSLLAALLLLAWTWREPLAHVDWYHYRPATWVAADLRSPNGPTVARAWDELERRRREAKDGWLAETVEHRVAEAALAEQALPEAQHGPLYDPMVVYLARRSEVGNLPRDQEERFIRQACRAEFEIRPVLVAGEPVYAAARAAVEPIHRKGWKTWQHFGPFNVGEASASPGGAVGRSGYLGYEGRMIAPELYVPRTPGPQPVKFVTPIDVYFGSTGDEKRDRLVLHWDQTLEAIVTIVDRPSADDPKLTPNPELADRILKAIKVEFKPRTKSERPHIRIRVDYPPVNVAFAAALRVNGKESPLPSSTFHKLACAKDESVWAPFDWDPASAHADKFDVVFRSSGAVARLTPDLFEIWDGELVVEGVSVTPTKRGEQ